MLKNIVFDFGNVIMNYDPDQILNNYALKPEDHDLLKKVIFDSPEWLKIDAGNLTEKEATKIFVTKVPARLQSKVKQIMITWPQNVDFYEPVFYLIRKLKKQGYHIFALSNTGMHFANFVKNSEIGDYFDGFLFSAQEKLMKPDLRIYQRFLIKFNLKGKECLFVDDQLVNTEAAAKVGMHVFTFDVQNLASLRQRIKKLSA